MNSLKSLSESDMLSILSYSPNATALYTTEDVVIEYANQAMLSLWNRDADIIGLTMEEGLPELVGQPFIDILKNVWKTGVTYEARDTPAELLSYGELKTSYFDFIYKAVKDQDGKMLAILHTAEDVTERNLNREMRHKVGVAEQELQAMNEELSAINEELETANEELLDANDVLANNQQQLNELVVMLTESESKFRNAVYQAPVSMCMVSGPDHVFTMVNDKMLKIMGKSKNLIGMTFQEGIPEFEDQPFLKLLDRVYTSGETYYGNEEKALVEHNGVLVKGYFNFIYQPLMDKNGQVADIMIVAVEVTDEVKGRIDLEKAGEKLRFAIESANAGTWTRDLRRGDFAPSNRYKELFGFRPDEDMPYEATLAYIHEDYKDLVITARERAIKSNEPYSLEYPIILGDEKVKWLKSYGKVENDSTGNFPMLSGIVLDITEQKLDEIRKNDFIAIVSHELKTPLTSLKGYTQLLNHKAKKDGDEFTVNTLTRIENQVNKMHALINGFLNVSRLEAGKITLDKKTFDLQELIADCIEETRTTTSNHVFNLQDAGPMLVHADREKIWAVVCNLLSNAVKYAPNGCSIDINSVSQQGDILVSIKDRGMGIRPSDLEKLFDRFYRVENAHSNSITGFGIGLYLSAEIIKCHEGKIWAESEFGQGTTFYFTIPS